ncbi:MAG: TylF/MycF/NovP-related O-methyltransferase [Acidobacteriaceae bacterium]
MADLQWMAARLSYGLVNYRHPIRAGVFREVLRAHKNVHTFTTPLECAEIFQAVAACNKVDGDMAEAGVFQGGTALLMLAASPHNRLHLFDTFAGLPHAEGKFEAREWAASIDSVKRNLILYKERLVFHPGLFPASAAGLEGLMFSCVHLDLDLYDSTLAALQWFWPRLLPGGVLVSHDYPLSDGVVRAFQEFFDGRPEPFIPLSGNQCLAVKN